MARSLSVQERFAEAEEAARVSEYAAADDDLAAQMDWRGAKARALAGLGMQTEALDLASEAVRLSEVPISSSCAPGCSKTSLPSSRLGAIRMLVGPGDWSSAFGNRREMSPRWRTSGHGCPDPCHKHGAHLLLLDRSRDKQRSGGPMCTRCPSVLDRCP